MALYMSFFFFIFLAVLLDVWLPQWLAYLIVLILLLIFIGQNSQQVTIHYLGMHGHVSLAIALLLAAVLGVLLLAIPGSLRIMQLRRNLKRNLRR